MRPEDSRAHGASTRGLLAYLERSLESVTQPMGHTVPFSKGGATEMENLRPMWSPCNLFKGNRSQD